VDIPTVDVEGVPIRVMMGSAYGIASPVKMFAKTFYAEAYLQTGQTITLPDMDERAVYVVSGRLTVRDTDIPAHSLTVFSNEPGILLQAVNETRIVIIGGEKIHDRFIEWNFVSSRQERIQQAKEDWKAQRFPKVPGDEIEFIPLPE
jgi:redox-sensitive bicupin YhaK (pirin superfamily)